MNDSPPSVVRDVLRRSCVFAVLFLLVQVCFGQYYTFKTFATDDLANPLPKPAITFITQDDTGHIWMAPFGFGLSRYDGSELVNMDAKYGVPNQIFNIVNDGESRMWVACAGNGFFASNQPLEAYQLGDSILFDNVIDGIQLPKRRATLSKSDLRLGMDGTIWMSRSAALYNFSYQTSGEITVDSIDVSNTNAEELEYWFNCVIPQANGDIKYLHSAQYIYTYHHDGDSTSMTPLILPEDAKFDRQTVNNAWQDDRGWIYMASFGGHFLQVDPATRQVVEIKQLFNKQVKDINFRDGLLLLSTVGHGLIYYDPDSKSIVRSLTKSNGLPSNIIWTTLHDQEDNLWIATNSGVARVPGDFLAYGYYDDQLNAAAKKSLPTAEVNNVFTDIRLPPADGSLTYFTAVCSQRGFTLLGDSGLSETLTAEDGLVSNAVLGCHQDYRGRIFILTASGADCLASEISQLREVGIVDYQPVSIHGRRMFIGHTPIKMLVIGGKDILTPDGSGNNEIMTTWLVTRSALFVIFDGQYYAIGEKAGITDSDVNNITVDDRGIIYVSGTNSGIFTSIGTISTKDIKNWEDNITTTSDPRFKIVTDSVFQLETLVEGQDTITSSVYLNYCYGQLWSTDLQGLTIIDTGSFKIVTRIDSPPQSTKTKVVGIRADSIRQSVWIAQAGLYEVDPQTHKIVQQVQAKDGLVSDRSWGLPGLDIDRNGIIHYATNKGLSIFNPALKQEDTIAPSAKISELSIKYPRASSNQVEIAYAALSYGREGDVRFKTKLIGQDKAWSEETADNALRYTNLRAVFLPKHYEFQVLAKDTHGNWQESPTSASFSIRPPWYLHWLSILLYLLLLYLFVKWYSNFRNAQLIKKKEELEETVKRRTAEVVAEKERSEELLLNILPAETAEELKNYGSTQAKDYDMVTVLFTDFKGFTALAKGLSPQDLIAEIDHCFRAFDAITEKYGVEKIKTIGDAYMAAAGLPSPRPDHVSAALSAAFEMRDFMSKYQQERRGQGRVGFEMRIGLHSGPVVAGIVGIKKFAYDIWGDTVNIASRMESNGEVGKINISQQTYESIIDKDSYDISYRGEIEAKNRGTLKMYFIDKV